MAILVTTASVREIMAHLEKPSTVMEATEFQDMERSFPEGEETYHVFALFADVYGRDIENAITKAGKKFKWL